MSKVYDILVSSAFDTLFHISTTSKKRPFKDSTLKNLCDSSRRTWSKWNSAGRPSSGPLWEAKKQAKKQIINVLHGIQERKKIMNFDQLFKSNDRCRFKVKKTGPQPIPKLRVEGTTTSDPSILLDAWSSHFHQLAKSEIDPSDPIHSHVQSLWVNSFDEGENDVILDVSITTEEVEGVLSSLKKRKSPGPDIRRIIPAMSTSSMVALC